MKTLSLKRSIDFYIGGFILAILYFPIRLTGFILKRDHSLKRPKHIFVIKLLGGGSLFSLSPTLFHLQQKYPDVKISLIGSKGVKAFAGVLPFFHQFIEIEDHGFWPLLSSCLKAWWALWKHADVTIDLELHSRLTTALTSLSATRDRIGLIDSHSQWRRRIYTHSIYVFPATSSYSAYDALAQLFGIDTFHMQEYKTFFKENIQCQIPSELENLRKSIREQNKSLIALGLFCSDLAKERELPFSVWSQLLQNLAHNHRCHFLLLGGPQDKTPANQLIASLPVDLHSQITNACGLLSLKQSIQMIEHSRFFIGIDSALIHLARFLEVPQLGFWGPTKPSAILHPSPVPSLHFSKNLSCSPCVHVTNAPPCQKNNICMKKHSEDIPHITTQLLQVLQNLEHKSFTDPSLNQPIKTFPTSNSNTSYLPSTEYIQDSWAYMPDGCSKYLELKVHY
jgi:ADP-heptose:LPS heptosyltransferase